MIIPAGLCFMALVVANWAIAAEPAAPSPRADSLELLFDTESRPRRLELYIDVDGQALPELWDASFSRLAAYCDRNGDGVLDRKEAGRLPSPFAIRQLLWGQLATSGGEPPPFTELDLNGDGETDSAELSDWYRRVGLGGALVGVGRAPASEALTDALLKLLDGNRDGAVDQLEWRSADTILAAVDANDDELIGPGELVSNTIYPGTTGATLLRAPTAGTPTPLLNDSLPFLVLPLRRDDVHWILAVGKRRQQAELPALDRDSLATLRQNTPAVVWNAHFGKRNEGAPALSARGEQKSSKSRLTNFGEGLRFELRFDEGKLDQQLVAARTRFVALFSECDSAANDILDERELMASKARAFQQLLPTADLNDDATLSKIELNGWLDLQEHLARGQILLTVLDHGIGLFELLDTDHDGSLSVRELRQAWTGIKAAGCAPDGLFDRGKLPRHLLATISRGHPLTPLGRKYYDAPAWYLAMDRNRDGDISRREFTGAAELFDRLDTDRDGFLSPSEAAAFKR